jgi:hypothetical protein
MKRYKFTSDRKLNVDQLNDYLVKKTGLKIYTTIGEKSIAFEAKTDLIIGSYIGKIGTVYLEMSQLSTCSYEHNLCIKRGKGYLLYHIIWGLSTLGYIEIEESMMRLNFPIEYRMIKWWKRLFSRLLIEEIGNNNFRMYVTPDYYG